MQRNEPRKLVRLTERIYTTNLAHILGEVIGVSLISSDAAYIKLTDLNVWDKFFDEEVILYMSYKCGEDRGNVVVWEEFVKNISIVTSSNSSIAYYDITSCKGRKGMYT